MLDNVSVTVPRGTFAVLLGLNGAGKSTLFSLITRLYDNVSGEIRILGHDVRRRPGAALQRLGVVFQSKTVDSDLSLQQNLLYHAALHGLSRREAKKRAAEALAIVDLSDRAKDKVRNLSGGQSRRVEIARSLMQRPGCLLLDEAHCGPRHRLARGVICIVRGLVARRGPRRVVGHASHRRNSALRPHRRCCTREGVVFRPACRNSSPAREPSRPLMRSVILTGTPATAEAA